MKSAATRFAKRWLYIGHRWLGIVTCLLCAMWFVSGVVMMYVPYPRLTDRERLMLARDVDVAQVAISPDAAMRAAGVTHFPSSLRLSMLLGEPVYRVVDGPVRKTISAVDGRDVGTIESSQALSIVMSARKPSPLWGGSPQSGGAGVARTCVATSDPSPQSQNGEAGLSTPSPTRGEGERVLCDATVETVARDQWTVAQGFNPHRPLHKVILNDEAGTELYVSSRTGEIVQDTTRRERFWNWLGSVPHWIYPTILRQDGETWRQVVLWTSGPATIGAVAGLWVGILRLRLRRRYRGERTTPYRGWMKWHHIAGIVAGLFLTTWLWSGWLSVNPFRWFDRAQTSQEAMRAYAGHDAPTFANTTDALRALPADGAREIKLLWFDGRPLFVAVDADLNQRVFEGRTGQPVMLDDDTLARAAMKLVTDAPLFAVTRLTEEDAYWYSHHNERRLPVLRAEFGDDASTWLHLDPATGEVLGRTSRSGRLYRWLFNALHDFDLRVLLRHRPAWDIVVWLLSIGGMIVSVSGVVIGWRRLGRRLAA